MPSFHLDQVLCRCRVTAGGHGRTLTRQLIPLCWHPLRLRPTVLPNLERCDDPSISVPGSFARGQKISASPICLSLSLFRSLCLPLWFDALVVQIAQGRIAQDR